MDETVLPQRVTSFLSLVLALAAVGGLVLLGSAGPQEFRLMAISTLVVTASSAFLLASRWGWDLTNGPLLYLILFAIFHFGLIWTLGLLGADSVEAVSPTAFFWVRSPYLPTAVFLATVAVLTFALVSNVFRPKLSAHEPRAARSHFNHARLGLLGVAMQVAGLSLLLQALASNGGFSLLGGGYLAFLEAAQSASIAYGIWAFGLGSSLTQLGKKGHVQFGVITFTVFAVTFFPLGLRGSVLFPALAMLATRAAIGYKPRAGLLAAGAMAVLALSAVVRRTRVGEQSDSGGQWYSGITSTITELGFSLRPTTDVLRWSDAGSPHSHFISFVAVPVRLIEKLTGWHGGPPAVDTRLFNVKVNELAGPIGGSPVAEGYDAGGTAGVVAVMIGIALLLSWLWSRPRRCAFDLAVLPVVLLPVLVSVRNSFAPVLPQMALGLVIVYLAARQPTNRAANRPAPEAEALHAP